MRNLSINLATILFIINFTIFSFLDKWFKTFLTYFRDINWKLGSFIVSILFITLLYTLLSTGTSEQELLGLSGTQVNISGGSSGGQGTDTNHIKTFVDLRIKIVNYKKINQCVYFFDANDYSGSQLKKIFITKGDVDLTMLKIGTQTVSGNYKSLLYGGSEMSVVKSGNHIGMSLPISEVNSDSHNLWFHNTPILKTNDHIFIPWKKV